MRQIDTVDAMLAQSMDHIKDLPESTNFSPVFGYAVGRAINGEGHVTAFDDLGPYCFVLGRPESDIEAQAEAALGALADDEERYADLIKTLDAFIRLHGSVNAVARDLFLHRNTVRQRLRRIGQLTGADLADPNDRLALQLALIGREALEHLT